MNKWMRAAIGVAVVAAGVALWIWSGRGTEPGDFEVPLLPIDAQTIVRIEIHQIEGTSVLERTHDGGWSLTGVVADYADSGAVRPFLRVLGAATAGGEIPGATPADSRFGFTGGIELLLVTGAGQNVTLGIGALNQVTGLAYARGAGRAGVFVVAGPLRERLLTLPDAVRLRQLLPRFARADVETVRIFGRGASQPLLIARDGGRWWMREPAAGLGPLVARYQQFHDDRRRSEAGTTWVLASDRALSSLIFEVSETPVKAFVPAPAEADVAAEMGLDPPYRSVELLLAQGQRFRLDLGEAQEDQTVWARRGDRVLATTRLALHTIESPFAEFAYRGAFTFLFAQADSFAIDQRLIGRADPDSVGRWLVGPDARGVRPEHPRLVQNLLSDMQVAFDGLQMLDVLPPATADPLQPQEHFMVTAWVPGAAAAAASDAAVVRHDIHLGRLRTDGRAAAWEPATGKLLTVSEEILISLRALRLGAAGAP